MSFTTLHDIDTVSVGFMPLLDCALLVAAHEKGFATREGLALRLVREVSWANVRDRIAVGHLDAAQMLAPMVLASAMGLWPGGVECAAPVGLGRGGNAITVSRALWARMRETGVTAESGPAAQAMALARVVAQRAKAGEAPLTLAMVFPYSSHHYQLRDWLALGQIDADHDVRLVVVPPPLLVEAIRTGQVDGFCVGEPWSSLAVDAGLGAVVATASEIWPRPPEKVLGIRRDQLERRPQRVGALVRAVHAAAVWVSNPANRDELASLLSQPRYVGAPASLLRAALDCRLVLEPGGSRVDRAGFVEFDSEAIRIGQADARLLLDRMRECGQLPAGQALVDRAGESLFDGLER